MWLRKGWGGSRLISVWCPLFSPIRFFFPPQGKSFNLKERKSPNFFFPVNFLGGDNNLNVVIGENAPHVRCDKSPAKGPPWESCLLILSDMAASANREVFGVKGQDPRVEVNLPYFLKASELKTKPPPLPNQPSTPPFPYRERENLTLFFPPLALLSRRKMPARNRHHGKTDQRNLVSDLGSRLRAISHVRPGQRKGRQSIRYR